MATKGVPVPDQDSRGFQSAFIVIGYPSSIILLPDYFNCTYTVDDDSFGRVTHCANCS
jgi:hypothetical protein